MLATPLELGFFQQITQILTETKLCTDCWIMQDLLLCFLSIHCAKYTAHKMKFSIKDFFSKCNQIHSFLRIWSHLLKRSLIENFIFWSVICQNTGHVYTGHGFFMTQSGILYAVFLNLYTSVSPYWFLHIIMLCRIFQ